MYNSIFTFLERGSIPKCMAFDHAICLSMPGSKKGLGQLFVLKPSKMLDI